MLRHLSVALLLAAFSGTSTAWGALYVDINDVSEDVPALTQPGFVGVTRSGETGINTDIGVIDISFAPGPGSSSIDDRDRNAPGTSAAQPLGRLLRDLIYSQADPYPTGAFTTTIEGLDAGSYLLTGYFHDTSVAHHLNDIEVSVDSGATFSITVPDAPISTGSNPSSIGRASIPFTVAAGQDVVMRLIGDGGQGSTPPGPSLVETAILSGFVVEPFTEYGDFNTDNIVDADDFFVLSGNLGAHLDEIYVGHSGGDLNLDGRVDLDDFGMFRDLFPAAFAAATGTVVPEPSSLGIATIAILAGLAGARHRRRHAR